MNSLLLFLLNVLDMFVARWSRFLDTTDVKGVKAQGEFWQREAVKTVRILAKLAEVLSGHDRHMMSPCAWSQCATEESFTNGIAQISKCAKLNC